MSKLANRIWCMLKGNCPLKFYNVNSSVLYSSLHGISTSVRACLPTCKLSKHYRCVCVCSAHFIWMNNCPLALPALKYYFRWMYQWAFADIDINSTQWFARYIYTTESSAKGSHKTAIINKTHNCFRSLSLCRRKKTKKQANKHTLGWIESMSSSSSSCIIICFSLWTSRLRTAPIMTDNEQRKSKVRMDKIMIRIVCVCVAFDEYQ